jgi:hypothetical protein
MRTKTMRLIHIAALLGAAATLAWLPGTTEVARADAPGTPTTVNAFGCIVDNAGHVTRPAGSTIVIRQGFSDQPRGVLVDFLGGQTTLLSVNDAQMVDVSDQWSEPVQHLRLSAEMKTPGRIWLQFEVDGDQAGTTLRQTVIFDPNGLAGLAYWYALYPVHHLIFEGMLRRIERAVIASGRGSGPRLAGVGLRAHPG